MTTTSACERCGAPGFAEDRFCGACGAPRTPAPVRAGASTQTGETSAYGARLLALVRKATVGEYEIRGEIGRGGMAAVYLAYDLRLNRKVAVKVMLPELALHEGMEDRFRREARTAAKLDHPNIVVIYSVRDDGELLYFVMKFIEGASLEQLVRKNAALPIPVAQSVVVQLANALQYAHDEGVVHRDVKPANVLIDRRGNTLVTDFGIAKATESPTLTRTGSVIGTPAYMSPEQCMGHEQTHASDQYALGVVAYELLAGRPPFVGPSVELQWAHVKTQPPPLIDARPDCPPALADAVMRMLAKDPAERWPSLQDVLPTIATGLLPGDDSPRAKLAELVRVAAPLRTDAIGITPASPIPRGRGPTRASPVTPVTPVTSITIAPQQVQLEVGDSLQLSVVPQPTPAPGVVLPLPTWSSSAPAIAAITPAGVVTAVASGSAIITAQAGSAAASTTVAIRQAAVASVRLQPLRSALEVGTSAQMTCVIRDSRDRDVTGREVDWASSNPRVASVATTGEVTANAPGKTTIGATCDAITATVTIEVVPERVATVIVTPATLTIEERASGQLSVRANDARGKAIGGRQVMLRSADPSIATVEPDGIVTARSIGRTRVDATIEGQTAAAEIVVRPATVTSVTVTPQTPSVVAGDILTFAATLHDATGHVVSARSTTWSSSDAAVLQVDAAGRATARKAGVADVAAECDGVRATARVTVAAAPIVRLEIVVPQTSLRTGRRLRLSAKARDKTGRELVPDNVAWRSSNPAVATVAADGTVTAVAPGEVTCFGVVGTHEGQAILTVVPAPVRRGVPIAVPIAGGILLAAVAVGVVVARGGDDGGVRQPAPAVVPEQKVANPVTPVPSPGPVAVAPPGQPAETPATPPRPEPTTPAAVASIRVTSRNPLVLETGQTSRAIVRAATADGNAVSSPRTTWSSADPTVATVNTNGVVVARGEGRTSITAASGGVSTRLEVVVNRAAAASVAIAPRAPSVRVGEQTTLSARIRDRAGAAMSSRVLWRSSNSSVAVVDNGGTVSGVRPGDVTVTATAGSASDSVRVTVTQAVAVAPPVREQPVAPTPRPTEEPRPAASTGNASAAEVDAALIAAARTMAERFARGQLGPVTATGPFSKFVREDQPQLAGPPQVQRRNVVDNRADGEVSVPLRWRTFTGAVRNGSAVLRITLEHEAGTWRPTSARNLNVP